MRKIKFIKKIVLISVSVFVYTTGISQVKNLDFKNHQYWMITDSINGTTSSEFFLNDKDGLHLMDIESMKPYKEIKKNTFEESFFSLNNNANYTLIHTGAKNSWTESKSYNILNIGNSEIYYVYSNRIVNNSAIDSTYNSFLKNGKSVITNGYVYLKPLATVFLWKKVKVAAKKNINLKVLSVSVTKTITQIAFSFDASNKIFVSNACNVKDAFLTDQDGKKYKYKGNYHLTSKKWDCMNGGKSLIYANKTKFIVYFEALPKETKMINISGFDMIKAFEVTKKK